MSEKSNSIQSLIAVFKFLKSSSVLLRGTCADIETNEKRTVKQMNQFDSILTTNCGKRNSIIALIFKQVTATATVHLKTACCLFGACLYVYPSVRVVLVVSFRPCYISLTVLYIAANSHLLLAYKLMFSPVRN